MFFSSSSMVTCLNLCFSGSTFLVSISAIFPWRLHFQKDAKLLSPEKRSYLESKIRELSEKLAISRRVELLEIKGLLFTDAQALGFAASPGRLGIAINPESFDCMPEEMQEVIIAHELSHIRSNDFAWVGICSSILGVITALALHILFPSLSIYSPDSPAAIIGFAVSTVALIFFSRWREECADKRGLSICSAPARVAAPYIFEWLKEETLHYRNDPKSSSLSKLWRKFCISEEGEDRLDILHPSLKTRIRYIRQADPLCRSC